MSPGHHPLVDFMLVGAQKCGTTTLYEILSGHERIVGSRPKEPHVFTTCDDWRDAVDRYERAFDHDDGDLRFEASTSYTFPAAAERQIWDDVWAYNPEMRILYLVRDPIDRIVSHYMHRRARGRARRPLPDAVSDDPDYLEISRYATRIRPWIDRFGRDRVRILFFGDLVHRRHRIVRALADFLDVSPDGFEAPRPVHSNASLARDRGMVKTVLAAGLRLLDDAAPALGRLVRSTRLRRPRERPTLPADRRRAILGTLAGEIDRLEALTGRDLSAWREA